jgi:hypothetical protein
MGTDIEEVSTNLYGWEEGPSNHELANYLEYLLSLLRFKDGKVKHRTLEAFHSDSGKVAGVGSKHKGNEAHCN